MQKSILRPNYNCWRITEVDQISVLFDAHAYYQAFFDVAAKAQDSILVAGWELDSQIGLGHIKNSFPDNLRQYFNQLVKKHRRLSVHILCWKASAYLKFGREHFAENKWKKLTSRRIHFKEDKSPYLFSSYHEKMSIIDNSCAFLGGIDLTKDRWDTRQHKPVNKLRKNGPRHDIQLVCSGKITEDLVKLYKKRLRPDHLKNELKKHTLWPQTHRPQLEKVKASISRTDPQDKAFEIENFYLDAIKAANHFIFIENQYFSHEGVADLLCERLQEPKGPEVIIISPLSYQGIFERAIFLRQRDRLIKKLKRADKYNRLGIFYPALGVDHHYLIVHSKLLIVDNRLFSLGSANLNYRSMRVDREININIEAEEEKSFQFIKKNLFKLLTEHLHLERFEFEKQYNETGSVLRSIQFLKEKNAQTLKELPSPSLPVFEKAFAFLVPFVDIRFALKKYQVGLLGFSFITGLFLLSKVAHGS